MQKQDILFHSNFCRFSKEVIDLMTKYNIRQNFVLVCVDNKNYQIPKFIDRVPSILKISGEVFTDDQLYKYLESKSSTVVQDISPIMSIYGNNTSYSMAFSAIEEDKEEDNPNFVNLGRDQHMIHVKDEPINKTDDSAQVSKALERLKESRSTDDMFIKKGLGMKV